MSYESSHKIQDVKSTEIIEDYLELIRCSYPYCNCGKCITQRNSHHPPNYQYQKNLKSSYKNEFDWKQSEDKIQELDGKKQINHNLDLKNCFKEHLKSSFISVMKNEYSKNLKLKEDLVLNNLKNQIEKVTKNNDNGNLIIKINNNINANNGFNYIANRIKYNANQKQSLKNEKINSRSIANNNNKNFNTLDDYANNPNEKKINIQETNLFNNKNNNINNNNNKYSKENIINTNNKNKNTLVNNLNSNSNNESDSNYKIINPPFIGRSSYELMYPDWQITKIVKEKVKSNAYESVPFNSRSSYQDNYHPHEKRYYINRAAPILKADNLESSGKLTNETTNKQTYMPIDYKNYKELNVKVVNVSKRPSSIVPAPYSKDSFLSSYERAFMYNNLSYKSNAKNVNRSVIY
jgi:hypothetical protein